MTERHEPTISPLATHSNEPGDEASSSAKRGQASRPQPVSSRPVIVRSPVAPFALVVALISLGLAGFIFWQGYEADRTLKATKAQLDSALGRVSELEQRLMLSDDESTQSLTVVQAKVKENASEVRKLWGVSNDKNKKAITGLSEQLNALKKSTGASDSGLQGSLSDVSAELQILKDLTQGQQTVIAKADKWMGSQTDSLKAVSGRLNKLDKQVNKRLKENEEAIKSIDAFRVQINRELIKLKGG